jgi:hypothetical protein
MSTGTAAAIPPRHTPDQKPTRRTCAEFQKLRRDISTTMERRRAKAFFRFDRMSQLGRHANSAKINQFHLAHAVNAVGQAADPVQRVSC